MSLSLCFFFFFPGNRSIIYNSERGIESQNLSPHRFEAAILREIVPHKGLSCLHFLELVFPQFDPGYLAESESAPSTLDQDHRLPQ